MTNIAIKILPLLLGLAGGVAGTFAVVKGVSPSETHAPIVVTAVREQKRSGDEEGTIRNAVQNLVFLAPGSMTGPFLAPSKAHAVGVALTSDGLFVSAFSFKAREPQRAFSFDRRLFKVIPARTIDKKNFTEPETGLSFFMIEPVSDARPSFTPASFLTYDSLEIGARVISFAADGSRGYHQIIERTIVQEVGRPLASDSLPALIKVDGIIAAGSPLFTLSGELVGIANKEGRVIPAEFLANILKSYLKESAYRKILFGAQVVDLNQMIIADESLPTTGLLIAAGTGFRAVNAKSPAARAGLREGDVLTMFDGQRLDGTLPLQILLQRYPPGTEVEVEFLRAGEQKKAKVVLGAKE